MRRTLLATGAAAAIAGCSLLVDSRGLSSQAPNDSGALDASADGWGEGGETRDGTASDGPGWSSGSRLNLPSGDLSGDGVADLMVLSGSGGGTLHLFAGGPGFRPSTAAEAQTTISSSATCTIAGPFLLVDANDDGNTDLIAGLDCATGKPLVVLQGPFAAGTHTIDEFTRRIDVASGGTLPSRIAVGELDGDGKPDLIASYQDASNATGSKTGLVAVFSNLAKLDGVAQPNTVIEGDADGDHFGNAIEGVAGDLTGDAKADLLIGAHWANMTGPRSGGAYVFAGPLPAGRYVASDLAYSKYLGSTAGALTAVSVGIGDVNADDRLDVLIGADEDPGGGAYAGRIFIFPGPVTPGVSNVLTAPRFVSGAAFDELGTGLNTHGDFSGDGLRDVLGFGCCAHDGVKKSVGILVGVRARPGFSSVTRSTADFFVKGDNDGQRWGVPATPGDLNGDGIDDVVVGSGSFGANSGRVYVLLGAATRDSGLASSSVDLVIDGPADAGATFGAAVMSR